MRQVALLVELGRLQTEAVHDIDDGLFGVVEGLLAVLGAGVGAHVEALAADGDVLAVGLVDDVVDEFEAVGVGDDLVVGDEVLG